MVKRDGCMVCACGLRLVCKTDGNYSDCVEAALGLGPKVFFPKTNKQNHI